MKRFILTALLVLLALPAFAAEVNLWLGMSQQAVDEFIERRNNPLTYSGPMDNYTFRVLEAMKDQNVVMGLFKKPVIGGTTYHLFSIYLEGDARVAEAINNITAQWPTHIAVIGAWWMDGRQVGTRYDDEGSLTGTPLYPIHNLAYRFMPDVCVGDPPVCTAATSNADLRDVNLLVGQQPRDFSQ